MTDTASAAPPSTTGRRRQITSRIGVFALIAFALTAIAQALGSHKLDLGFGTITLFPIIWGLLLGAAVSMQRIRPVPLRWQRAANYIVEAGVLLLSVRLGFVVGHELPMLKSVSSALLLQEVGHLFGTVVMSLPIAVLLRMGRPAVGACFSIDRESSFAMVSDRYGPNSDEYRGVLGMYIFGSVVGALYVTLLAGLLAGWNLFSPLALAMGTGVGSGSVMAASSAAVAEQFPDQSSQILAVAALSNLVTSLLGVYVGMFLALPMADRFYRLLTRGKQIATPAAAAAPAPEPAEQAEQAEDTTPANPGFLRSLVIALLGMVVAVAVFGRGLSGTAFAGFALIAVIVLVGVGLKRLLRIPPIATVSALAIFLTSPVSPVADLVLGAVEPVDFGAMTTTILVFAGLSLGKEIPALKRLGWRIVPVGLVSFAASFIGAAAIAEAFLD
ncbi:DUF3100 domain-containing protein [Streptomyces boluensis]|uniref:DUF3100 domain-containing protein n=1 Tax=Streptomyces boluensis TaxID=1775135 RepID=A0A964UMF9_9ACTN|nr:DUF3100 domain-containing protein [Streptomyces boluensis]NBE51929.1 DUF3100 domain-containing protein [Streptomyces boluensis]